jgi:predicted nucleic acid-binding protein
VEAWLEGMIAAATFQVLAIDAEAARTLGRMMETPSLRGFLDRRPGSTKPRTGADLQITAIAIASGAAVVTANTRDFSC